jgi:1,4-dihydroxy-2-naphthoyl-CoA synthase
VQLVNLGLITLGWLLVDAVYTRQGIVLSWLSWLAVLGAVLGSALGGILALASRQGRGGWTLALLSQLVGRGRASELMLLSEKVNAARCLGMGIFNRVVPDTDLQAEAFTLARQLAHGPALAQALIKDNLDDSSTLGFQAALDNEAARLIRSSMDADHAEAVRAFVEKRAPRFRPG